MTKLSRSKIELSIKCPRCFWFDQKAGVKRPSFPPYTINSAIDYLLKQEFDTHRAAGTPHPIMQKSGVDAVPFAHPDMDKWRHNFTGVQVLEKSTDLLIYGAVDDIWINPARELMVVDYKATGANEHHIREEYGRQMEIYQWLLRGNGFQVAPRGYFVFARVNKGGGFSSEGKGQLPFDIFVEPYEGDSAWVPEAIRNVRRLLDLAVPPAASEDCEYCKFIAGGAQFERIPAAAPTVAHSAKTPRRKTAKKGEPQDLGV